MLIFFSIFLVLIAFINAWSVRVATTVQNVLTFAKLLAIAIISGGGIYKLATGKSIFFGLLDFFIEACKYSRSMQYVLCICN